MDGWAVGCEAKTLRNLAQASGAHPSQGWGPQLHVSCLPAFLLGSLSLSCPLLLEGRGLCRITV